MNTFHYDYEKNTDTNWGARAYHVGNNVTPLDFATTMSGPIGKGANRVPVAGGYASVNTDAKEEPEPRSLMPHLVIAGSVLSMLMMRR